MLDVYIGFVDFEQEFEWDCQDPRRWQMGNVPNRQGPFFPNGHKAFWFLVEKIKQGILDGKQTDWAGWTARVTKDQISAFISELYSNEWEMTFPQLLPLLRELRDFVDDLDPIKGYYLAAVEV